ncbi:hypothetical protein PFISCL1PPCAC_22782, partial [Pristionchus fissidentatus]
APHEICAELVSDRSEVVSEFLNGVAHVRRNVCCSIVAHEDHRGLNFEGEKPFFVRLATNEIFLGARHDVVRAPEIHTSLEHLAEVVEALDEGREFRVSALTRVGSLRARPHLSRRVGDDRGACDGGAFKVQAAEVRVPGRHYGL